MAFSIQYSTRSGDVRTKQVSRGQLSKALTGIRRSRSLVTSVAVVQK